jgi:uncharacterized membrane-anchored protein YhcB (DUF1043 family)
MDATWICVTLGVVTGVAVAALHLRLAWRAAQRSVRTQRPAWLGFPLRIGIPVVAFVGLAKLSPAALVAGLAAFAVVHRIGAARYAREAGA